MRFMLKPGVVAVLALVCTLTSQSAVAQDAPPTGGTPVALPAGVTVVASGLTNPRGFTWGADGTLYLTLAGVGGDLVGTYDDGTPTGLMGGLTASVATIENGCAVPLAEELPSTLWVDASWTWGVMDVAILDDQLYILSAGGGIEGGFPDVPNGIFQVGADGSTELVADLSAWMRANPTSFLPPDYGQDGSLFDLEAEDGLLWVSEAVGGRVLTVSTDGEIALVADLSQDHQVPTGLALDGNGGAFIGHETTAPYPEGSAPVFHVAADGTVTDAWTGLTATTDVVMGPDGMLYAAMMGTNNLEEPPFLRPHSGQIVRQTGPDSMEVPVTDIDYPVGLGFGPDGALYLTTPAFGEGAGEGLGSLLRIDLTTGTPISLAGLSNLPPSCEMQ
jgi:sugar lactone lactonase YvrE